MTDFENTHFFISSSVVDMETIKSEGEILQVIDDLYDEGKREGALQGKMRSN